MKLPKLRIKLPSKRETAIIFIAISYFYIWNTGYPSTVSYIEDILRPFMPVQAHTEPQEAHTEVLEPYTEIGTKAWAMKQWSDRFSPEVAWQLEIIMDTKESGWNADAYHCNTNGTVDLSWYQVNTVHVEGGKLSLTCAADPICSTAFAMDLYDEQSWCPWYGAKALGFCK